MEWTPRDFQSFREVPATTSTVYNVQIWLTNIYIAPVLVEASANAHDAPENSAEKKE